MRNIFLTMLLATLSLDVSAEGNFKCVVKDGIELSKDGTIKQESRLLFHYVDSQFVVDSLSGIMTGKLSNHNDFSKTVVLDLGSEEQAYKALTLFKPKVMVDYLYIQSFSDLKAKPFMFITGSEVYSGTCSQF